MVAELEAIADSLDPANHPWANEERLAFFTAQPVPTNPIARLQLQGVVAQELLYSGRSQVAAEAFGRILETVRASPQLAPDGYDLVLLNLLGISYLRLGEQINCMTNHSGSSCILPFDEQAIHKARDGAENAIRIYSELLARNPGDTESKWLLNVAYASLGEHPAGVPDQYRVTTNQLVGPDVPFPRFRNIAPMAGLAVSGLSGGGITEDFDGDGDLDVMVSSWGFRDSLRYFENIGSQQFTERTTEAGIAGLTGGLNLTHADYDNDGDYDVLVLRGAWLGETGRVPNSLLRNDGDGRFEDVTVASGLYSRHPTQTAAWADFDLDGFLDVFIGNESGKGVHPSELYHNNGDGTFTEIAGSVGLGVAEFVKGVTWLDYDNDGDPDLYLSILGRPNRLFENQAGSFVDVTSAAGVADPIQSFPVWSWDYDNDGWEDLMVLSYEATTEQYAQSVVNRSAHAEVSRLYRNRGDGTFEDVTASVGLDVPVKAMGSNFGDLDNDGWLDFYVGTGDPNFRSLMPNKMFRFTGSRFDDVTRHGGFGHLQKGHAVSFADLDADGDQDVHAVMGGAFSGDTFQNVLFENPGNGNSWIGIELRGTQSNRAGVGARLAVTASYPDGKRREIHRTVSEGGSFGSNSYQTMIGLGQANADVSIVVNWPSGRQQRIGPVPVNDRYVVDEQTGLAN